jgi:hypothetical protein
LQEFELQPLWGAISGGVRRARFILVYSILATKKLLERMRESVDDPVLDPSTKMGNWFAKPLFWRPQYAIFVSGSTFLPVFAPLAPASTLAVRFPDELAATLRAHGVPESFIADELTAMDDVVVSRTNNRQVVGVLNEFAFVADRIRRLHPEVTPLQLALNLAKTPVGIHGKTNRFPDIALRELVKAFASRSSGI